jgi:hypothetical protein
MLSSCASFFDMKPFFFEPLCVDKALTIEIPGYPASAIYAASKRTFCAPFHSTVLPRAGKFSRPEVSVMK